MDTLTKQVDKSAYDFARYGGEDRFVSYQAQLSEIFRTNPTNMLEIGVGDKVIASYITNNTAIAYTSADIADDVGADVQASVTELPFEDTSFDIVCAFEVLEHLPFDQFEKAVSEMCRVARTHVLISVPHFGPMVSLSLKIPFLPRLRLAWKIPFPKEHAFNGQHHWEIGKKGYPVSRIRAALEKRGVIVRDFIPFNNPYHHFFTLELERVGGYHRST